MYRAVDLSIRSPLIYVHVRVNVHDQVLINFALLISTDLFQAMNTDADTDMGTDTDALTDINAGTGNGIGNGTGLALAPALVQRLTWAPTLTLLLTLMLALALALGLHRHQHWQFSINFSTFYNYEKNGMLQRKWMEIAKFLSMAAS
jgi:hypothetical protein